MEFSSYENVNVTPIDTIPCYKNAFSMPKKSLFMVVGSSLWVFVAVIVWCTGTRQVKPPLEFTR